MKQRDKVKSLLDNYDWFDHRSLAPFMPFPTRGIKLELVALTYFERPKTDSVILTLMIDKQTCTISMHGNYKVLKAKDRDLGGVYSPVKQMLSYMLTEGRSVLLETYRNSRIDKLVN